MSPLWSIVWLSDWTSGSYYVKYGAELLEYEIWIGLWQKLNIKSVKCLLIKKVYVAHIFIAHIQHIKAYITTSAQGESAYNTKHKSNYNPTAHPWAILKLNTEEFSW